MVHRLIRIRATRIALSLVAVLTALVSVPTSAASISGLHFTGSTIPAGQGGTDPFWQVVAWPTVTGLTPPTMPYDAFVFSGSSAAAPNVPTPWFRGDGAPGTNTGAFGGRWIGLQSEDATALLTGTQPLGVYSTVYATTFTADSTGIANFNFLATADNFVTFYVNGTLDALGTANPTIKDGTPLAAFGGLASLKWVDNSALVQAGVNTLYAVVEDRNTTGTYAYTGLILVPEPSTVVSAAIGVATIGLLGLRRRSAKRPRS